MTLDSGSFLAHYEVTGPIGRGGMGEVYRAQDTRLGREVAIKVLPVDFADDVDRVSRFEREAKSLAALNHPHIATVHGFEQDGDTHFLVMELVEGEDFAERLRRGPIPVDDVIPLFIQIAEGLEAAHEKGIVHRDLKPANLKLTADGRVKIVDFGLAKSLVPQHVGGDLTQSPTLTASLTMRGEIAGTAGYMSPEQARGQEVDRRADIWAFGCVLFEALSGRQPFAGGDVPETLARVIERDPDWGSLPSEAGRPIRRLLRRCLEKSCERRLRDIGDARLELEDARLPSGDDDSTESSSVSRPTAAALPWIAAAALAIVAAVLFYRDWSAPEENPSGFHLQVSLPDGLRLAIDTGHPTLALSPDGQQLVFVGDDSKTRRLYIRDLSRREIRPLPGTEGAASPFFSADGAWIGYFVRWNLYKVSAHSGAPIAAHTTTPIAVNRGATWLTDDEIVFSHSVNSGLASGTIAGDDQREFDEWRSLTAGTEPFTWPSALPDADHVLMVDGGQDASDAARVSIVASSSGEGRSLGLRGTNPRYSASGHVLYGRSGSLYAAPFELEATTISGPESQLIEGVITGATGSAQYAVGGEGTLAYVSGPLATEYELAWIGRDGTTESLFETDRPILGPRPSPEGSRVALTVIDGANIDVWLFDLETRALTRRLTNDEGEDFAAVWHPDGEQLALASEIAEDAENPGPAMAVIREIGSAAEPVTQTPGFGFWEFPASWSPDGRWLAYVARQGHPSGDIMLLDAENPTSPVPFLETADDEQAPTFSPNGRWLAFVSDETGPQEVYVQSFPETGERVTISSGGGVEPSWTRDGRKLIYRQGDRFLSVEVDGSGESLLVGETEVLLERHVDEWGGMGSESANYDLSLDGERLLVAKRKTTITATVIDVVLDWPRTLLERR